MDFQVSLSYSRRESILFYISYSEKPLNGAFPVNKIYRMTPNDHISDFSVKAPENLSGEA